MTTLTMGNVRAEVPDGWEVTDGDAIVVAVDPTKRPSRFSTNVNVIASPDNLPPPDALALVGDLDLGVLLASEEDDAMSTSCFAFAIDEVAAVSWRLCTTATSLPATALTITSAGWDLDEVRPIVEGILTSVEVLP
jgi:hypothetical protein